MSLKNRMIDGLNFIYNSGPQMCYKNGEKQSRWTLVVDEIFLGKYDGKSVPLSALADADAIEVRLSKNSKFNLIFWNKDAACKIRRVFSRNSIAPIGGLGAHQFENLKIINGCDQSLVGLQLRNYSHIEFASIIDLTDSRLLQGCSSLCELLLWSTDFRKLDASWIDDCFNLKYFEIIECLGVGGFHMEPTPSVNFLRIVKPSQDFLLSKFIYIFKNLNALALDGVRTSQVDCVLPSSIELFRINGNIVK